MQAQGGQFLARPAFAKKEDGPFHRGHGRELFLEFEKGLGAPNGLDQFGPVAFSGTKPVHTHLIVVKNTN